MRKTFGANRREKPEPMELDITSLLDILVILLVFLLKSYNASNLKLDLVKSLAIPDSKARKLGSHAIVVQVDQNKDIWIDKKKIGRAVGVDTVDSLYSYLKQRREVANIPGAKTAKQVNLVLDKSLAYSTMQKVMHTSAMAGYTDFKFIVQGNY